MTLPSSFKGPQLRAMFAVLLNRKLSLLPFATPDRPPEAK